MTSTSDSVFCFATVPDNSPQNVTTTAISSTEILVSWEEVPAINQNGEITMYEIQYEPLEMFGGLISTETVNASNGSVFTMALTGLEEYVEYNISVRAYTSAGPGPYSDPVTERTFEDGMTKLMIHDWFCYIIAHCNRARLTAT